MRSLEPDRRGISPCHVRCAVEGKSTRAKFCFAMRERANLTPENEYEIHGQQKQLRLDSVAVLGDRINEIIRNRGNQEDGGEKQPPPGASRQHAKEYEA